MTGKEKFSYWWKILFLIIFGIVIGMAAVYTIIALPFNFGTLVYLLFGLAGFALCEWAASKLIREYYTVKRNDANFNKQ